MAGRDTWSGLAWLLTLEHSLERTQRHLISKKSGPVAVVVGPRARAVLPYGWGRKTKGYSSISDALNPE